MIVARTPRLRLDRTHRGGTVATGSDVSDPAPASIELIDPAFMVFAVIDAAGGVPSRHDRQVIGASRVLAGDEGAVVVLAPPLAESAAGADRSMVLPGTRHDPAIQAAIIAEAIRINAPRHVIFAETMDGGDLARRVAAACGEALFANAERVSPQVVTRPARAGRAEFRTRPPRLISIAADRIAPYSGPAHVSRSLDAPAIPPIDPGFVASEPLPIDAADIPLGQAPLVIAAGSGVTDFAGFLNLARALGATPGASRVVCDAGDLPRTMQVGASGTVLDADCYIALGISGAPQHLQGIGTVDHVVAINTDLHAAIIARAGLAIIADAQAVMAAMLASLQGMR